MNYIRQRSNVLNHFNPEFNTKRILLSEELKLKLGTKIMPAQNVFEKKINTHTHIYPYIKGFQGKLSSMFNPFNENPRDKCW